MELRVSEMAAASSTKRAIRTKCATTGREADEDEKREHRGSEMASTSSSKRVMRSRIATTEREVDQDEKSQALPDDLVEKIIAMVPFPSIFKARGLSKAWLARFAPVRSHTDEEKKRLAISFQEQVGERFTCWKTFCPIFISKESFVGYDKASQRWRTMSSLSFLPQNLFVRSDWSTIQGALLLISDWPEIGSIADYSLYVANVLTRQWKLLPPRPPAKPYFGRNFLIPSSSQSYKVVVLLEEVCERNLIAHIYNSESGVWTSSSKLDLSDDHVYDGMTDWEYFNGFLYRVIGPCRTPRGLLAFNVSEGVFEVVQMPSMDMTDKLVMHLAVCDAHLLMIRYSFFTTVESALVVRIDLGRRQWVRVTEGPPAALNFGLFQPGPASDGDSLFFVGADVDDGVLAYNVRADEWSRFPGPSHVNRPRMSTRSILQTQHNAPKEVFQWDGSSFQPSLNPFVEL